MQIITCLNTLVTFFGLLLRIKLPRIAIKILIVYNLKLISRILRRHMLKYKISESWLDCQWEPIARKNYCVVSIM